MHQGIAYSFACIHFCSCFGWRWRSCTYTYWLSSIVSGLRLGLFEFGLYMLLVGFLTIAVAAGAVAAIAVSAAAAAVCIATAAAALGSRALTAANDGLVTRISLEASAGGASECRNFYSIYGRLHAPLVERMSSLSLPLTHPHARTGLSGAASESSETADGGGGAAAAPATPDADADAPTATTPAAAGEQGGTAAAAAAAAAAAVRSNLDILVAADEGLILFPRSRTRACFEAKFIDTAGHIAAAALESGFVALADFR